jgi:hypothetical protein
MEQRLIDVANKVIEKANKSYNEFVEKEDYSESNSRQGYLNGLKQCFESVFQNRNIGGGLDFANWNLEGCIREGDWGKAAYWQAYVNGFEVMKIITKDKEY